MAMQSPQPSGKPQAAQCENNVCITEYEPSFFSAYAPITALDMVNNLPGFTIRNGNPNTRGFDATTGNILINGKRATSKSESASEQLAVIPVDDVEVIELLQGQLSSYDLIGQTIAVNIVRKSTGATGTMTLSGEIVRPDSTIRPSVELSYSSKFKGFDYTANMEVSRYQGLSSQLETVFDGNGQLREVRNEVFNDVGDFFAGVLNTSRQFGDLRFNSNLAIETSNEEGGETSRRNPIDDDTFVLLQPELENWFDYEAGFDLQKPLTEHLTAKVILLLVSSDYRERGALDRGVDESALQRISDFVSDSVSTERILRFEFDYNGIDNHLLEFSLEGAVNKLDSDFSLSTLENGALTPVDVPGAKTSVEEKRLDTRITDSVKWGNLAIELALGAEYSKITQIGGFEAERDFFFLKPSVSATYPIDQYRQLQLRARRRVGQLDFFDFTSATDLGDVELALGNPELEPEVTNTVDIRYEHRTEGVTAFTATLFYDWIDDVADIVPLTGVLEVPGNIGTGYRYGARSDFTLGLDSIGLAQARIDGELRWQESGVDDPLTGDERLLSNEEGWDVWLQMRQDLEAQNLAWGMTYFADDTIPEFGLDERVSRGKNRGFNLFIEKRDWFGFRTRLTINNVFRGGEDRNRIVFAGPRNTSPVSFREFRQTTFARRFELSLSKTF